MSRHTETSQDLALLFDELDLDDSGMESTPLVFWHNHVPGYIEFDELYEVLEKIDLEVSRVSGAVPLLF